MLPAAEAQLLAFPHVEPICPPTLSNTYQVHWPAVYKLPEVEDIDVVSVL